MGIFGSSGDRRAKRAEKQIRSLLAQRDAWWAELERLRGSRDVNGLIDLIVDMERHPDAGWPLVLEAGRAAASFGSHTVEVVNERPLWPEHAMAFGLVLALVGTPAWDYVLGMATCRWPEERLWFLPALAYFAVFEGPEQEWAQRRMDNFASSWEWDFGGVVRGKGRGTVQNPELRAEVERVKEFCSHVNDPDYLEDTARMALDVAEFNRLFDR